MVATATLVHSSVTDGVGSLSAPQPSTSALPPQGQDLPSRPRLSSSHGLETGPAIEDVLNQAHQPSTLATYAQKWKSFCDFAEERGVSSCPTTLDTLLQFLLLLFHLGLSHSTLKVYISAIVAYQPPLSDAARLFQHPVLKRFLKGLHNMHPA